MSELGDLLKAKLDAQKKGFVFTPDSKKEDEKPNLTRAEMVVIFKMVSKMSYSDSLSIINKNIRRIANPWQFGEFLRAFIVETYDIED